MRRTDALRLAPGQFVVFKKGAHWNRRPLKIHAVVHDTEDPLGSPRFVLIDTADAKALPTEPVTYLLLERVE